MKIKKILMSLTAAVTALTAGLQSTVFAYAAPINTKYISEIKSIRCESADEAKKAFEAEGYTMLDTDVNPTLEKSVYIGYKTSSDINDAITDLKFMNMQGQYSFSQYEEVLKNHRNEVDAHIAGLIPAIEGFRENYEAGKDGAVRAYLMMNNVYDAASDSKMGDFLLNCSLKENDREPLVNAMMKGNAGIVQAIERYLAMAAADISGKWFEKLEDTSQTELLDSYMEDYPVISKAQRAMAQDFGVDAMTIKATLWDELYMALQGVEENMTKQDDGIYDISAVFDNIIEDYVEGEELSEEEKMVISDHLTVSEEMISVYETLSSYEYDGESLLDFFNRPSSEVTLEEIYPLISVMTDAQRGTLSSTGLVEFLMQADAPNQWDNERKELFQKYSDATEGNISLYFDVNLRAFEDGVAMTSAATQRDVSNVSFLDAFRHNSGNDSGWDNWTRVRAFGLATGIAVSADIVFRFSYAVFDYLTDKAGIKIEPIQSAMNNCFEYLDAETPESEVKCIEYVRLCKQRHRYAYLGKFGSFMMNVTRYLICACEIFTIIFAAATLISAISMLWKSAVYTDIPALICDAWEGDTFSDYVFYDAVQGLNQDDAKYADMNGYDQSSYFWSANQGWLVLYYTKDKRVGSPLTELKLQTGDSKAPLGYEGAAIFGEGATTNLTSKEFTGQNEDPQIYLFYKRAANILTGTVRTTGGYILTGAGSLLAGGLIGGLIGSKRKKKTAGTPAAA